MSRRTRHALRVCSFAIAAAVVIALAIYAILRPAHVSVGGNQVSVTASRLPVLPNLGVEAPQPVVNKPVNQVAPPAVVVKAKQKSHRIDRGEADAYAKAYANAARANQLLGERRFNTAGAEFIGLHRALTGGGMGFVVRYIAVDGG